MTRKKQFMTLLGVLVLAVVISSCLGKSQVKVKGIVWLDENADGMRTSGEKGVEGVIVRVVRTDPENPKDFETSTDKDGIYAFEIPVDTTEGWAVVVEPHDARIQFTYPNVGEESQDSDVDPGGRAAVNGQLVTDVIDAGLLPVGISRPPGSETPAPLSSPVVTEEPAEHGGSEVLQLVLVSGHVYIDHDADGLYSASIDELLPNIDVQLVDRVTGEVLDSEKTKSDGQYGFGVAMYENELLIKVVANEDLVFSLPAEGNLAAYPSQVNWEGISIRSIDPKSPAQEVNAGLHYPYEGEVVYGYDCATGEPVDVNPFPGIGFAPGFQEPGFITWTVAIPEMQPGMPFCIGIDFTGEGVPVTGPNPEFALGQGVNSSVSTCILDGEVVGVSRAVSGENGELVELSTSSIATISEGSLNFRVPIDENTGGMTDIRLALSDLGICTLSGDLAENNGYRPAEEFGAEIAQALAASSGTRVCDVISKTCLMLPADLEWERTGDQTLNITINGVAYNLQFDISEGTADARLENFTDTGWTLEGSMEIQTPLRVWQLYELHANGQPLGLLAVSDNKSGEPPAAFAISAVAAGPLTDADLQALKDEITTLAEGFRSAFELPGSQ